jgi:hypothetical protein
MKKLFVISCSAMCFLALTMAATAINSPAPPNATYITKTADGTLTSEFAMGSLGTGVVLNTTTTGTPVIATLGSGLSLSGSTLDTASTIASGTYTPTLTNTTNVAASTAYACQYLRIGNTVTVSGKIDVDATTTATISSLKISLPVTSDFTAAENCAGVGSATVTGSLSNQAIPISADTTADKASLDWVVATAANSPIYFTFTYKVQ